MVFKNLLIWDSKEILINILPKLFTYQVLILFWYLALEKLKFNSKVIIM